MKGLSFKEFMDILFLPVLSAGVFVLWDLNKSVNSLNVQVAVLISTNSNYAEEIKNMKEDIKNIKGQINVLERKR